jgi:hypothetical protein
MVKDLAAEELKDPFSRAMKRAFEPIDVWTPRRLWMIRIVAIAGAISSIISQSELGRPAGIALFVGSVTVLSLCNELGKLCDRVERLESDALIRDLSAERQIQTADRV